MFRSATIADMELFLLYVSVVALRITVLDKSHWLGEILPNRASKMGAGYLGLAVPK